MNEKSISLDPPPFLRVRIAARAESATAAAPLEVEIFVVRPDGTPDDHAKLELTPDEGEVEVGKRTGPGIYLGQYTPPPGKAGAGRLEARVNGQPVSLEVPVRAAKVRIAQPFWP